MAKASKQERIEYIIKQLEQGMNRGTILPKFVQKWPVSDRTFTRMLKIANTQHMERLNALKEATAEVDRQAAIDARKKAIMTAEERKEHLTKIAKGEVDIPFTSVKWDPVQEKFVTINLVDKPSHTARISAIAELNKMEGNYAPTKIAPSKVNGDDLPPPPPANVFDLSMLSNEELATIINISSKTVKGE